ncbi:hypothetical protein HY946_02650, partial [Candidatus Gottesmanbacteria bacterium]|nr:hypothetical protein [Candidatus Gottesmanbacteria bacterium]
NESEYKKDQTHLQEILAGKLPENPALQVKLPVRGYIIPAADGWCWVDAAAGIVNYLEPDIDFDKFILLNNPTLMMAERNKDERFGPGANVMAAFIKLGYTPFRGATTPIHPPQNVSNGIEPQNLIYFKTKEEELNFMKRLLSANIIPVVTLTRDPFELIEGGSFNSLVGFDQNGVWLNVSPPLPEKYAQGRNFMDLPQRYEPRFLSYDKFFEFWTPDHQLLWAVKTGNRKADAEIYAENKKNVQEASQNLQKTIRFLKGNGDLQLFTAVSDAPTAMVFYRYFQKKGDLALANQYLEMAKTYVQFLPQSNGVSIFKAEENGRQRYIKTLEAVYPYSAKIATMWP